MTRLVHEVTQGEARLDSIEALLGQMSETKAISFQRLVPTPALTRLGNRPSLLNLIEAYENQRGLSISLEQASQSLTLEIDGLIYRKTQLEEQLGQCPTCGRAFPHEHN